MLYGPPVASLVTRVTTRMKALRRWVLLLWIRAFSTIWKGSRYRPRSFTTGTEDQAVHDDDAPALLRPGRVSLAGFIRRITEDSTPGTLPERLPVSAKHLHNMLLVYDTVLRA